MRDNSDNSGQQNECSSELRCARKPYTGVQGAGGAVPPYRKGNDGQSPTPRQRAAGSPGLAGPRLRRGAWGRASGQARASSPLSTEKGGQGGTARGNTHLALCRAGQVAQRPQQTVGGMGKASAERDPKHLLLLPSSGIKDTGQLPVLCFVLCFPLGEYVPKGVKEHAEKNLPGWPIRLPPEVG